MRVQHKHVQLAWQCVHESVLSPNRCPFSTYGLPTTKSKKSGSFAVKRMAESEQQDPDVEDDDVTGNVDDLHVEA